jgi:hypothetical protein
MKKKLLNFYTICVFLTLLSSTIISLDAYCQNIAGKKRPIFIQKSGVTYVFTGNEHTYSSVQYNGLIDDIVVNGKMMKGNEVNKQFNPSDFQIAAIHSKEAASALFNIQKPVFELKFKDPSENTSLVYVLNSAQVDKEQKQFLEENAKEVEVYSALGDQKIILWRKDASVEKYDLCTLSDKQLFLSRYKWIPVFPKSQSGYSSKISSRLVQ